MNFTGTYIRTNENKWVYILGIVDRSMDPKFDIDVICRMLKMEYSVISPILKEAGAKFVGDGDDEPIMAVALNEQTIKCMIEAMDPFILPFRMESNGNV